MLLDRVPRALPTHGWKSTSLRFLRSMASLQATEFSCLGSSTDHAENVLKVHPRGNKHNPLTGVFATRSPDRPNPIGLHRLTVRRIEIIGC